MEPPSQNNTSGFTPVSASSTPTQQAETKQVRDVWNYNLEKEMNEIMKAAMHYPFIGMVWTASAHSPLGYGVSRYLLLREGCAELPDVAVQLPL